MISQKLDGIRMRNEIVEGMKIHLSTYPEQSRTLGIFAIEPNAETQRYIQKKQELGASIGIQVIVRTYSNKEITNTQDAITKLKLLEEECGGVIVQLPVPMRFDIQAIINSISPNKDVDALCSSTVFISPVAQAVQHMLEQAHVWTDIQSKHCVVVGAGETVGKPVIALFQSVGVHPTVLTKETPRNVFQESLIKADVIVSGVGFPGLIQSVDISDGVVLIDAGFSFYNGKVSGDIDSACFKKASFYSTVPGGVGPLAIAFLFKNLLAIK